MKVNLQIYKSSLDSHKNPLSLAINELASKVPKSKFLSIFIKTSFVIQESLLQKPARLRNFARLRRA